MAVTDSQRDLYASRLQTLEEAGLIDTIVSRRSRRFALGAELDAGPLSYRSDKDPIPLTEEEEAILVFAGAGVTGYGLEDVPWATGQEPETGSGNVVTTTFSRAAPSADGLNSAILFVLNDEGAFQIRRPHEYPPEAFPELVDLARRHEFVELYRRSKIRLSDHRPEIARRPPVTPPFNRWSTNLPGSTYFVLVGEVTPLVFSILFFLLNEEGRFAIFDDRNRYRPAGIKRFFRSKGGHLEDDPNELRVGSIHDFESYIMELVAVEQGLILQNMQLAAEALGLGGFPHYAAQRYQWLEALGFRMEDVPLAEYTRRGRLMTAAMNALGKNPKLRLPLGLEVEGEVTVKPFCPPWYSSMEEATHAFVDWKFGEGGTLTDGISGSWKDVPAVQAGIDRYSKLNIDAVVAYAEYVYGRYGRFPAYFGPLRSLMGYSAHHIDLDFYDEFYKPGAYTDLHREHFARWHAER